MKKYILILVIFLAINQSYIFGQENNCDPSVLNDAVHKLDITAVYLKDFQVYLPAQTDSKLPVAKFSMVLAENNIYQFAIANSDEYTGKAIFQLYEDKVLIGSTYNAANGKCYDLFTFKCKKSKVYDMHISFVDGKEGCAVGIIAFNGKF